MIGSHLFINLQVTALAAEKRVRRKRKASGFDRANVKGRVAMRGDTCVLTVNKKSVCFFFESEYFLFFFFGSVFLLLPYLFVWLCLFCFDGCFWFLPQKRVGRLVFVYLSGGWCPRSPVNLINRSRRPLPNPRRKSERKNESFLVSAETGLKIRWTSFFWLGFLGPLNTQTLLPRSVFFVQNLCDTVFFAGGHLFLILGILSFCRAALISQCWGRVSWHEI